MAEDLSVLTRSAAPPDLSLRYGEHPDQVADVWRAEQGALRPLLVIVHGGFWKPEYDRAHAQAMSAALAQAGWTVLTLEYRRIPGQPFATLSDVDTALESLPPLVAPHNGELLLLGHSAGGHLALWAAQAVVRPRLRGVVALAPAADLRLAHALNLGDGAVQRFLGSAPERHPAADPMRLPTPCAPITILQGEDDQVVPTAVAQSYANAFPGTRLLMLPAAGHFALIDPQHDAWQQVLAALRELS